MNQTEKLAQLVSKEHFLCHTKLALRLRGILLARLWLANYPATGYFGDDQGTCCITSKPAKGQFTAVRV